MPRGGYGPKIRGVDPKHIYEAMLTGPQSMDTFSDGNIPPDDKRDVIAYLNELDEQPAYGGFGPRRPRTGERGPDRLAGRHRRAGRVRGLDRRPHDPHEQEARKGAGRVTDAHGDIEPADDHHGGELVPTSRSPTPGCRSTCRGRPTSTRRRRSAPSARSPRFFGLSAICTVLFVVAYFTFDIGDNWHVVGGLGASNVALGGTLGLVAALHRRRRSSSGPAS